MKFLQFFLVIILPVTACAQSNYRATYAIKNNGDTLKGYVNYKDWHLTPKSFELKNSPGDKNGVALLPVEIRSLSISGSESYLSYKGPLSTDKVSYPDLPHRLDTGVMPGVVFLKIMVTGPKVSLLLNTDELKTRLFIAEADGIPRELKYHYYLNDNDGGNKTRTYDGYKSQLSELAVKYAPSDIKINQLLDNDYSEANIEKVVWHINGLTKAVNKSSGIGFYAGLSANGSSTTFNGQYNSNTAASIMPVLNFGFNFNSNTDIQKVFFRAAITLSYLSENYASSSQNFKFSQATIGITPQLTYNIYNTKSFKYFISAGLGINLSIYPNNLLKVNEVDNTVPNGTGGTTTVVIAKAYQVNNPYVLKTLWLTAPIKTGVVLNNKTELYLIYNPSFLAFNSFDGGKYYSFGAGINFFIGK